MADEQGPAGTSLRTRLVVALVSVAVIALVLVLVLPRLGGDDDPGSADPSPAPPASTESPTDAAPPDQAPSDQASSSSAPSEGASGGASPTDGASGGAGGSDGEVNAQPPVEVSIDRPARPTDDLVLSVTRVEQVRSQAELPGETSRPALRITVQVRNTSSRAVPIGGALTNLYYGPDRDAATLVQRPGGRAFPESVPARGTATSVVVYNVPRSARGDVVLEVSLDATVRRVEFSGDCSSSC